MIFVNSYTSFPVGAPASVEYPPIDAPLTGSSTPINGKAYGNGTYTVSSSSSAGAPFFDYLCFDKLTGENTACWASTNSFNSSTNLGNEWVDITLPNSIILTSYSLQIRSAITNPLHICLSQAPVTFTVQGWSGSAWNVVSTETDISAWTTSSQVRTFTPTVTSTAYSRYRIVITKVQNAAVGALYASIGELRLFGY